MSVYYPFMVEEISSYLFFYSEIFRPLPFGCWEACIGLFWNIQASSPTCLKWCKYQILQNVHLGHWFILPCCWMITYLNFLLESEYIFIFKMIGNSGEYIVLKFLLNHTISLAADLVLREHLMPWRWISHHLYSSSSILSTNNSYFYIIVWYSWTIV